ncbi:MAG: YdeI/OmpD-associated family protein, partial [Acidimicrobiales bacterium]
MTTKSSPGSVRFTATLETNGKTATGIEVPETAVEQLGKGKKPPVTVTIGSHSYRSTVAVMGGRFLLPVSAENRTKAGIAAGDEVEVTLVLDEAPRQVTVPEDLAAALATDPTAKAFFEGLSFSQQRFH